MVIYLSFSWLAAFEFCHSIKILTIALKPCHYICIKIIIVVVFTSTEMVEMIIVCLSSTVFIKIIVVVCLSSTISSR